jgi:predicted MFS family arabinose efflux permease
MTELKENQGIPRHILIMMAVMAGITVANLYYNQPLLELIRHDTGATEVEANLITVISQAGYALGLFLIIPTGDLYPRRRIIAMSLITAAAMGTVIAVSDSIGVIWGASLFLGMCSVIPQLFIPIAGQFSKPGNKARNIGYVLSGLLTGILASRVISGFIGERMGWRAVFVISAALMAACMAVTAAMMPEMKPNFRGSYPQLMRTVWRIVRTQPRIRFNAVRSSLAFGSMLAIWSCLAFHLAGEPFRAGASTTGVLGLCGMAGAIAASGMGRLVPRYGIRRFSKAGALLQLAAWATAFTFGDSYAGLIAAIILADIGVQCIQLSNQSDCIQQMPEAANRANTIFMTVYFIGGALGTLCAGVGWDMCGWGGVCLTGAIFSLLSLAITLVADKPCKRQA